MQKAPARGAPNARLHSREVQRRLEDLERCDSVLRAVSLVAQRCLRGEDSAETVMSTLEALGQAAGANRVLLIQKVDSTPGRACFECRGLWAEPGYPPYGDHAEFRPRVGEGPRPGVQRWEPALDRGELIAGRTSSFPPHERRQFEAEGVRSAAIVPVFVDEVRWGHIGFDRLLDEDWHPEVLSALQIAGAIVGAGIQRRCDQQELERRVRERTRELAETNRALEESETLYRSVVDTSPDAIVLFDVEYHVLMANPSCRELFGAPVPAGQSGRDWIWPKDRARAQSYHPELLSTGCLRGVEAVFQRPDGTYFDAEISAALIRDAGGRPRMILHVVRNVSLQKQLEQRLRQAQKMDAVGRLASGIAHDFNNILTVVKGFGELLAKRLDEDSFPRYMATEIVGASDRAVALVEQLLSFSRKQMVEPKIVEVNSAVERLGAMLRVLLRDDIHFSTRLAPDTGSICIDPVELDQLIMNLAVNAQDAMPDGGTLTVSTRRAVAEDMPSGATEHPGAYVTLEVRDTGRGMSDEVRSHVFEPFFTTKEVGKGTGLGLATVYGIVEQAHGYVDVESAPGAGCNFRICLPRADGTESTTLLRKHPHTGRGQRKTVLVTENERAVRAMVAAALGECGHTVLEAEDGIHALEVVEQHGASIDLLLTDVVMPRMGGPELGDRLAGRFPNMRVLYTSGYTDKSVETFPAFLRKPFSPDVLIAKVEELFADSDRDV